MTDTAPYEIEKLDQPIQRNALEFKYQIVRNFPITYKQPVEKLDDGTYKFTDVDLEAGSTVMLFEDLETAEVSLDILLEGFQTPAIA